MGAPLLGFATSLSASDWLNPHHSLTSAFWLADVKVPLSPRSRLPWRWCLIHNFHFNKKFCSSQTFCLRLCTWSNHMLYGLISGTYAAVQFASNVLYPILTAVSPFFQCHKYNSALSVYITCHINIKLFNLQYCYNLWQIYKLAYCSNIIINDHKCRRND